MKKNRTFISWSKGKSDLILLDNCEVLSEVRIDELHFKATWSPALKDACILWFKDERISPSYEALGKFTTFDKRSVLDFIVRYTTSEELRHHIEKRRFETRVSLVPESFFENIDRMAAEQKLRAFEYLYDLDGDLEPDELALKRRIMAKKFHPDGGGSNKAMSVINEAYEVLSSRAKRK